MRSMMLAAMLVVLAPAAFAQSSSRTDDFVPSSERYHGSQSYAAAQPNPENCGTPDEPKACPPLPRHPLPYYPANRKD